jgi:hypothetical protein
VRRGVELPARSAFGVLPEPALRRLAQEVHDARLGACHLLYSWPSGWTGWLAMLAVDLDAVMHPPGGAARTPEPAGAGSVAVGPGAGCTAHRSAG